MHRKAGPGFPVTTWSCPKGSAQVPTSVILRSKAAVFVDLDILRQVRKVADVYQPIYFRNFAILIPEYLKRNKKRLTALNHRRGWKSFRKSPPSHLVEIKTRNNNMVNNVFERTADFRHFDIAQCDFRNNICLLRNT